MKILKQITICLIAVLVSGCAASGAASTGDPSSTTPSITIPPTLAAQPTEPPLEDTDPAETETAAAQALETPASPTAGAQPAIPAVNPSPPPEPTHTLAPDAWMSLPVAPESISQRMYETYLLGLELGNNPRAFAKIGDCGSTPAWFLGDFDRGPKFYRLGEYSALQPTIEYYSGSFGRTSLAAKEGFNAASVFTKLWANRSQCGADETPLACEYRVHRPSLALIMLGTNDVWHQDRFEPQMRQLIEFSLQNGVIPVLSTKADNAEGDHAINATTARLAYEYELPLWNYWASVRSLPNGGLQEDGAHITWAPNRFDDPIAMQKGWPVRNLTALQVLDLVRRSLDPGTE